MTALLGVLPYRARRARKSITVLAKEKSFWEKDCLALQRDENQSKVSTSLQPSFCFCWSSGVVRVYIQISEQIVARSFVGCGLDGIASERSSVQP